ncbi:MAG: Mov34/MPN/PAD-1 family protein [Chloroflexi bacterium]|nr:Mov34/MPN/PAD-1 family protein [Chloroflexota bacterium]MBP8058760.1 Mov34/MPN/PAD-1 family protein [Chloroflexota bacterium]
MTLPLQEHPLRITENALHKAQAYAHLVDAHIGPVECIGFLAGEAGSDLIDTVSLAPYQQVSATSAVISGRGVLAAGRELERLGKKVKGWWHSHGHLAPFHSHTDDSNTHDILNQIMLTCQTQISQPWPYELTTEADALRLTSPAQPEGWEIRVGSPEMAQQFAAAIQHITYHTQVALAYSLVVNARGDTPHAELHSRRWCPTCQTAHIQKQVVALEIISLLDEAQMLNEVKERVQPHPRPRTTPLVAHTSPTNSSWQRLLRQLRGPATQDDINGHYLQEG